MVIGDLLYGHGVEDLDIRLNSADQFIRMLEESDSFWLQLVDELLVKSPMVVVKGKPSKRMQPWKRTRLRLQTVSSHPSQFPAPPPFSFTKSPVSAQHLRSNLRTSI